jgi:hypothetical protein
MDFVHLRSTWTLRSLVGALAIATTLAGCSNSSKELRTPGQAAGFVVEVASGEPYDDWTLASDASRQAVQAWKARVQIGELGNKLRDAPPMGPGAVVRGANWTCAMTSHLVSLGTAGGITSFNTDDVEIATNEALTENIKPGPISAMIHIAETVPFRDLALATALVCGPAPSY